MTEGRRLRGRKRKRGVKAPTKPFILVSSCETKVFTVF